MEVLSDVEAGSDIIILCCIGCQKALQQDLRRRMPRSRSGSTKSMPLPGSGCIRVRKAWDDAEGKTEQVEFNRKQITYEKARQHDNPCSPNDDGSKARN
jgi:hypothetical protein